MLKNPTVKAGVRRHVFHPTVLVGEDAAKVSMRPLASGLSALRAVRDCNQRLSDHRSFATTCHIQACGPWSSSEGVSLTDVAAPVVERCTCFQPIESCYLERGRLE